MRISRPTLIVVILAALIVPSNPTGAPQEPARIKGAERVQVGLVLIDVVVRDRKDRPVAGLTRNDFRLLVDSLPAPAADIESFEEVCPAQPPATVTTAGSTATPGDSTATIAPSASTPSMGTPAPQAPATQIASPAPGSVSSEPRYIVLYLDFSQLSLGGRRQSLKSAREHVATRVGPNDRVMILAFMKSLRLVQDFTSDASLLTSRIDEMLKNDATLDSDVLEEGQNMCDVARKACDGAGATCTARRSMAATFAAREELRARKSLHAIEALMPSLGRIKGRKALVLFTDVLRDEPGVEYAVMARTTPQEVGINLQPELLRLTQEANASGVSIYTVHASGLDDPDISSFRDCGPNSLSNSGAVTTPGETQEAALTGVDSALAIQTTMATETGGHAQKRSNDVGAILDTAQQDLSCYYLIGYRYKEQGDNQRHSILVKLNPDANGDQRRTLTLRYRPYYTDISPDDRRKGLVRSALEAPDLYHSIPLTTEAFALAPEKLKRRVLVKATVPFDALSMVPSGESALEGRLFVRGEVTASRGNDSADCTFEQEIPLSVPRTKDAATQLVFETGCLLNPGSYDLALAVYDPTTQEVGARRSTLAVQPASVDNQAYVSDVALWTRDRGSLVVSAGAENIGMKNSSSANAFVPRSERRLARSQEALMSFFLCPAAGARPTLAMPIRVHRTLLGEGDAEVAGFRDLTIGELPDADTGCYQVLNAIPANTLGDGVYRFTIQFMGPAIGTPITREADLLVK